jgi:hypothetical protein
MVAEKKDRKQFDLGALQQLAAEVTPEDVMAAMTELRGMLKATRRVRAVRMPGETARDMRLKYQDVPDYDARAFAIRMFCTLKNFPTPTMQEIRVLHQAEQVVVPKVRPGADVLRELKEQGADVRALVDAYVGQLDQVAPEIRPAAVALQVVETLPIEPARRVVEAVELPE